jgi:hypothetical protein
MMQHRNHHGNRPIKQRDRQRELRERKAGEIEEEEEKDKGIERLLKKHTAAGEGPVEMYRIVSVCAQVGPKSTNFSAVQRPVAMLPRTSGCAPGSLSLETSVLSPTAPSAMVTAGTTWYGSRNLGKKENKEKELIKREKKEKMCYK